MSVNTPADGTLVRAKLSTRLKNHIDNIDIQYLSRVSSSRLAERALPNIGQIELVTSDDFTKLYDDLYVSMFPRQPERERSDLIVDRLKAEFAGLREHLAPYRIIGIRDHDGMAIGAAHFSVLLLPAGKYAVPYLQYLYVREQNRRQDMAEVLHTIILAVATADGQKRDGRVVPFTLFETEPAGYGVDEASRAVATQRAVIHTKAGAVAVMLRSRSGGILSSPHVQPGLEEGNPPVSLVWAIRRSPAMFDFDVDIEDVGRVLVAAYYQSIRDEGFPEDNIKLAENMVADRCQGREFVLMPLCDVVLPVERGSGA